MRGFLSRVLPAVVFVAVAVIARASSTGVALDRTAGAYLDALHRADGVAACSLLTDSLRGMIGPGFLSELRDSPTPGTLLVGREEPRGLTVNLPLPGGGSRTLWMRREAGQDWRISGDSSLDNLLGSASIACTEYARSTVLPAVSGGGSAEDFRCPVSGLPYRLEDGLLVCPSGHLGDGIDLSGDACREHRESVAATVAGFMAAGHSRPASLEAMHAGSDGAFGQPGGYRCPENGYAYYQLTEEGVRCPFHDRTSPIPLPVGEAPGETATTPDDGSLP